jgi:ATP-dependent helicase HrpB
VPAQLAALYDRWCARIKALSQDNSEPALKCEPHSALGYLLACAFPERVARRRAGSSERYLMASGKGVALKTGDPLTSHEFLVVATLQSRDDDRPVSLAAPLDPALFETLLQHLLTVQDNATFSEERGALVPSRQVRIGAIVLREERPERPTPEQMRAALEGYLRSPSGHAKLPFGNASRHFQARATWARSISPELELPDICDAGLCTSDPFWLSGFLPADGRLSSISESTTDQALRAAFSWNLLRELESLAPETFQLPSGKTRRISYELGEGPVIEATIQELFGLHDTPTIGRKQIRATLHLLSPARRPMQVTQDLASFWKNIYPEVRKELRGRYPKHKWPADPTQNE